MPGERRAADTWRASRRELGKFIAVQRTRREQLEGHGFAAFADHSRGAVVAVKPSPGAAVLAARHDSGDRGGGDDRSRGARGDTMVTACVCEAEVAQLLGLVTRTSGDVRALMRGALVDLPPLLVKLSRPHAELLSKVCARCEQWRRRGAETWASSFYGR